MLHSLDNYQVICSFDSGAEVIAGSSRLAYIEHSNPR